MTLNEKISRELKKLREERGYSLREMSELALVSKQGYHKWEQGLRTWKLDVLTELSSVLGFKIVIENGQFELTKDSNQIIREEVERMKKQVQLDGYQVITLYTGADNVNFEEQEILEEVMIYTDREDAREVFETDDLVPVYALFNEEEGNVCSNTYGLDTQKACNMYYWNYAPIVGDGNAVYVNMEKGFKVCKRHAVIDIHNPNPNGTYPILEFLPKSANNTLGVFAVTDLEGEPIPAINHITQDFPIFLL